MSCYAHFLYTFLYVHNFLYNFLYTQAKRRRQSASSTSKAS